MKKKPPETSGISLNLVPLFRPHRSRYIKRTKPAIRCVFCTATRSKISLKSLCVYKTKHSMVILNKYPYNAGHILVLPLRHVGTLSSLTSEQYLDLMQTLRLAESVISKVYQPSGVNIGLNQGAAAGAGIPDHLHFHLIPRWKGDLNFFPLVAKSKVIIEDLEESYHKILKGFRNLYSSQLIKD